MIRDARFDDKLEGVTLGIAHCKLSRKVTGVPFQGHVCTIHNPLYQHITVLSHRTEVFQVQLNVDVMLGNARLSSNEFHTGSEF